VEVDRCGQCGGVWLDHVEVEAAVAGAEGAAPAAAWRADRAYLKCPACGTVMNRVNYERFSGILLDVCPRDGIWADAGELQRARDHLAAGGRATREAKETEERRLERSLESWGTATSARAHLSRPPTTRHELTADLVGAILSNLFN